MPSITNAEFGHNTEALEVAKAFAHGIRGKTIIVTGANSGSIGFTTLQAFVSSEEREKKGLRGSTRGTD